MALLDFPTGPNTNDTTTQNGNTWKWNGTSWVAFNNLSLSSQVSGVLGTLYGGTGKALDGLTVGSVLYADTSTSFAALSPGTSNYVLATQGNGSPPYWKVDDSGAGSVGNGTTYGFTYYSGLNTVTSGTAFSYIVGPGSGGAGGTVILTSSTMALIGSTITSGTWAGSAVTAKYGGTGLNAISAGQLIYGSATDAYTALNHPGAGYALTSVGSTVAWQTVSSLIVASAGWAITAGSATTTANIYGGGAGSIPFNTGANATAFLTHSGAGGSILVTLGTTGVGWTNGSNLSVGISTNIGGGGAGSIPFNTASSTTTFLTHSGSATSVLVTTASGIAWTTQNSLFVGSASTAAQTVVVDDTSSSSSQYITWVGGSSGNQAQKVTSSKLTFVPSTGVLSATSFSGSGANLTSVVNSLSAGNTYLLVSASTGAINVANIGVQTLAGTANQVLVNLTSGSATTGAITLTLPQDIGTSSSPSFANISLTTGTTSTLATVGSSPTSIVNKQYVDNLASGLDIHASVRALQFSAIGASYIQPSTGSGVGASLWSTSFGAFPSIDGVSFVATGSTQRILIAGGATGKTNYGGSNTWGTPTNLNTTASIANGIYYLLDKGSAGSNWILVRATDTDENTELTAGAFTFIEEGTIYADTGWVCTNDTTNNGPIQFGLDNATTGAINFSQFTGASAFNVGQGLVKNVNTIGVKANIDWYGPLSNLTTGSGSGYSSFTIGGVASGTAGTSFSVSLRVGTATTYGSGTAVIALNETGFSMIGGTNNTKTLTITGDISLPSPTQYGVAYGGANNAIAFVTNGQASSGSSVLTQANGSNPVYLAQSQLAVGISTNIGGGGAGSIPFNTASSTTTFLTHSGSATSVLVTTTSGIAWTTQNSLFVGSATTAANIGGGGAGFIPFNTGSNATAFLTHSGSATSVLVTTASGIAWTTQNSLFVAYAGGAGTVANIYGGGAGSIVYNSGSNATTFLSHSGAASSVLLTTASGLTWTTQSNLSVGSATNAAQLNIASATGVGVSYLLFGGGSSGNQPVYSAVGITVMAQDSILYANRLVASGSTVSTSTSTGALIVGGGVGIGGSLWTNTNNFSSISGLGIISGIVTSGTWAGNAVTLLYGGTNNTVSGSGHSDKLAVYNSTGTAITSYALSQNYIVVGATGGTYAGLASTLLPIAAISSVPPAKPGGAIGNTQAGQLWWDSTYGVLKIYYADTDTSQWVDATPVLGSSGGGSSTKRSYVMTFGAGFTPSTGADTVQIQIPYAPDNTSKYYYIKRLDYRNETVAGGTGVSFYIERFTGGNAEFNAVSSGNRIQTAGAGAASSFVVGPAAYTTSYTLASSGASFVSSSGVAASIISGDYLRLNFTSIVSAATLSVSMVIEEQ
jgi:hypothetical protein